MNAATAIAERTTPHSPTDRPAEGLTLEVRRDLDLPPQDAAAFDALIDEQPRVGVFLSRAWLSGWFAEPPRGAEPSLLILRERGQLRGAVPLSIAHTRTHARIGLLGGGLGSDRVDLVAAPGYETVAADLFLSWLEQSFGRSGFALELRDVPSDSPLWGAIGRACAERASLVIQPREVNTLPYLDLARLRSGAGPGELSADPSAGSLDKHRRWLERRGRLRIEMLQDPADVLAALDVLARFLHERWQGTGIRPALDNPQTLRFHRSVVPRLLAEGRLRMIKLSADMRPIAVFYGLGSKSWWGYYLSGYDREWAGRIHLGQITLATAIGLALQEGAAQFDFLKGVERVKYLWPVLERTTMDADLYSDASGAQLARALRGAREGAAALVKSARNLRRCLTR